MRVEVPIVLQCDTHLTGSIKYSAQSFASTTSLMFFIMKFVVDMGHLEGSVLIHLPLQCSFNGINVENVHTT